MRQPAVSILVNSMADEPGTAIALERLVLDERRAVDPPLIESATLAHREDRHAFFVLEAGTLHVEIDFQVYVIAAPALVYMPPEQVHRLVSFRQLTVSSLGITTEKLNPTYRPLLAELRPATPVALPADSLPLISEAFALCCQFAARPRDPLYYARLQDSCNALVALLLAYYLPRAVTPGKRSPQGELLTQAFLDLVERHYATLKRPGDYARQLHVTPAYLNACVNARTGASASHTIQQRVLLEAKRLLYYSSKSVKEIAAELGYVDYPYFSRLFAKAVGMTALAFRATRLD